MRRSRINRALAEAEAFLEVCGVALPPFARWSPAEFAARAAAAPGIVAGRLGWDVTDYGQGRFEEIGLTLLTCRNGDATRPYAEKLMVVGEGQVAPMHRHMAKTEDIVNRAGGVLTIELFGSAADGRLDRGAGGRVLRDGAMADYAPGEVIRLAPGESVTLVPGDWHAFWAEDGRVLAGEVSSVNDDETDNWFLDPLPRFAEVEEDAPPRRLLVSDYAARLG